MHVCVVDSRASASSAHPRAAFLRKGFRLRLPFRLRSHEAVV